MHLTNETSEIFVPDGVPTCEALERVTALGVGAHQDDLEILAYSGIIDAFGKQDAWFMGAVVTNGSGSARAGIYSKYSDEEMCQIRRAEQKKAAILGEYAAMALLDYPSSGVKNPEDSGPVNDLKMIIEKARPDVIFTHNLADKHDTHVAVTLRLIQALRELPEDVRPKKLYGCEVWRDLDWMCDEDKVTLKVDSHENMAAALLGVYDSQIAGGKRYDLATMGRRRANATFFASHEIDDTEGLTFAIDMTDLMQCGAGNTRDFVCEYISRFEAEVVGRIAKLGDL